MKKRLIIIGLLTLVGSLILTIYIISNHSENSDFPKAYEDIEVQEINSANFSALDFEQQSTYDNIVKSINIFQPICYSSLIDSIDTHCDSNQRNHQILLSVALTSNNQTIDTSLSLDSMYFKYKLAFECKALSKGLPNKSTFYKVISDYWFRYICNQMSILAVNQPDMIYDHKYNLLYQLLQSELYTPNVKKSTSDKVIYNLQQSKFGYLIYKFKVIFGIPGLIISLAFVIFTLYLYVKFFLKITSKKQTS